MDQIINDLKTIAAFLQSPSIAGALAALAALGDLAKLAGLVAKPNVVAPTLSRQEALAHVNALLAAHASGTLAAHNIDWGQILTLIEPVLLEILKQWSGAGA